MHYSLRAAHYTLIGSIKSKKIVMMLLSLLFLPLVGNAQLNPKAKEAFNKGQFEKAVSLYTKDFKNISANSPYYNSLKYNLAEAYRLSGNLRIADSLHATVDFSKTSYWGYALTLLQQYRADKCLTYAKHHLKFDAQHPELTKIESACELIRKKVDESKVVLKTFPLPSKKERLIVPGFIIGKQSEEEAIAKLSTFAGKRKDATTETSAFPISISGIFFKGKEGVNYSILSPDKVGYSIDPSYFTHFYNPAYFEIYKITSKSKLIFDPTKTLADSLKSLSHFKEFSFYEHKEVVKQAWISPNKNVMVFSSNKLKGEGGYDLFMTTLTSNGWTKPVNLGSRVNSTYNEISPYISPNGILYYSSNGFEGHGGYDIYSFDLNQLETAEKENLSKPFNSAFDDYGFLYHEQTGFGVFASTRPNGIFSNQLFRFENKLVNCDAKFIFRDYPEITNKNANPKYCIDFDMLSLQESLPKGKIYSWQMGDGKKAKGLKFSYCYSKPGFYKAKLVVYDPSKKTTDTTKYTKDITVPEKDFLKMEYSTKNKAVEFTTVSSNCKKCDNVNYYWDFGDGTYGCGFTIVHTYATYGAYNVRLIMKYKKEKKEKTITCYDRIIVEEIP